MYHFCINNLTITKDESILVELLKNLQEPISITSSLALVGQSGSGKSLTLKSILNLLPENLQESKDFQGNFQLDSSNVSFIPQNPFTSLSPLTKIEQHFTNIDGSLKKNIDELLSYVGLESDLKNRFPSHLSGGQLQRVVIAIALSNNPKLLLLDEPTTALDQQTRTLILELLKTLQNKFKFLMIFVSHDIESIKTTCNTVAIMNKGTIVEYGDTKKILTNPQHSYTKELIESDFKNRCFRQ